MNKQEQEAEIAGLLLLNKADKSFGKGYQNYNFYLFKDCGHTQYLQPTHVRRKNVTCHECRELDIKVKAELAGLTYLGPPSNNMVNFRSYRSNQCGHITDLRFANVSKRTTERCSICYEDELKVKAEQNGLTYLGKSELNGTYRRYKFNKCSHEKDIAAPCVSVGRFECKDCIESEKEQMCKDNGLRLISKSADRYWEFELQCGHIKSLRVDHAIDGSWLCDVCGDSHYTKPSILYLYRFDCPDFKWLKLGFSRNLSLRKANYKLPRDCASILLYSREVATGYEAQLIEKAIHNKLKSLRLCKKMMTQYMQSNGHTECYPLSAIDQLLKELNGN